MIFVFVGVVCVILSQDFTTVAMTGLGPILWIRFGLRLTGIHLPLLTMC